MKYLFITILFFSPLIFLGATPGTCRSIDASPVTQVQALSSMATVQPMSGRFDPAIPFIDTQSFVRSGKLAFKERLRLKILKFKKGRLGPDDPIDPKKRKLGKWSLYMGIGAFATVIIPIVGLFSVPLTIAAIVTGIISLKGNNNVNGIIGICLGGLFMIVLAALIAVLIIAFR